MTSGASVPRICRLREIGHPGRRRSTGSKMVFGSGQQPEDIHGKLVGE